MKNIINILSIILLLLAAATAQGQIIEGNVYGGGNAGNVSGNATVTVTAGDIHSLFGGARQANVGGRTFVNIDGANATSYILIDYVFGGNDIGGTIGQSATALPAALEQTAENNINDTWNALLKISTKLAASDIYFTSEEIAAANPGDPAYGKTISDIKTPAGSEAADAKKIYIGQLFGGGNGDYEYTPAGGGKFDVTVDGSPTQVDSKPELARTYLEVTGGSIVYAYGGGNKVTVTDKTVICVDNPSKVVNSITDADNPHKGEGNELLTTERFQKMRINTGFSHPSSDAFQIGRFFGGNNKAEMAIAPTWNLKSGLIRNLYSGGNSGDMTYHNGLLLEIPETSTIKVDYLYGGCRMADVKPLNNSREVVNTTNIDGYKFPNTLSARVLVKGGDINNIFGGNDVTGKVYGGSAIGIYTSIRGNVYGGGNGAYPYTDNTKLIGDDVYGDLYYNPGSKTSVQAFNDYRPITEQTSIRLKGTDAEHPTIIRGSVYLGGNCATISGRANPRVELKIGSHVIADNVYLGNNGADAVRTNADSPELKEGILRTLRSTDKTTPASQFNTMNLLDAGQFSQYMDGIATIFQPRVIFDSKPEGDDANYIPYSSSIGSFFCGGNRGSIKIDGADNMSFNNHVIIYNKLVGGSNDAHITATDYNAEFKGGVIGNSEDVTGNKTILNLQGIKLQPKRWKYNPVANGTKLTKGDVYYTSKYGDGKFTAGGSEVADGTNFFAISNELEWNVISAATGAKIDPVTVLVKDDGKDYKTSDDADLDRRLLGANVFGGCYHSGIVNGNVIINVDSTAVDLTGPNGVFDEIDQDYSTAILYNHEDPYHITARHTGVISDEQGMDVLGDALSIYGGGSGKDTEIWGSTNINLNSGYTFQVFGGGQEGVIGKSEADGESGEPGGATAVFNGKTYHYSPKYSTTINLKGSYAGVYRGHKNDHPLMADVEFIYGGSFLGPIAGNTTINLGNGRIFNSFAGSCNADILGHTETYVGRNTNDDNDLGFPWIRDHIYGGNDLGGRIMGKAQLYSRVRSDLHSKIYNPKGKALANLDVTNASAYIEYIQGRMDHLVGGCYGDYEYNNPYYSQFFDSDGNAKEGYIKPRLDNAFVYFRPNSNNNNAINHIYGAGEGFSGDSDRDIMQNRSYVLIDGGSTTRFDTTQVFGGGDYCGLGMYKGAGPENGISPELAEENEDGVTGAAVIDLMSGKLGNVFGGSYNEGIVRRTIVNVPEGSSIWMFTEEDDKDGEGNKNVKEWGNIFGGAYGTHILPPCDVYESTVNYRSSNAIVNGNIFGGNNNERRTLYAKVNIFSPVRSNDKGYLGTVYGAGKGVDTWTEHTEINLENNAEVYEVYGGGLMGHVLNAESAQKYMQLYKDSPSNQIARQDPKWRKKLTWSTPGGPDDPASTYSIKSSDVAEWHKDWKAAWVMGPGYYVPAGGDTPEYTDYASNAATNLSDSRFNRPELDNKTAAQLAGTKKYNTNVIIKEGAYVGNYAYGGGYGKKSTLLSGDIYGLTYIALLGGIVKKDIYASGTSGSVDNLFGVTGFTASSNAFIKGGTCRNVYGGGWEGNVGVLKTPAIGVEQDRPGETHVVIGRPETDIRTDSIAINTSEYLTAHEGKPKHAYYYGRPAIQRNAYAGGEGGSIFGDAHIIVNNGYIGYGFLNAGKNFGAEGKEVDDDSKTEPWYAEKIDDETYFEGKVWKGKDRLADCGNVFGSGYDDVSSVDNANIKLYGGTVRNCVIGGGEMSIVGRGTKASASAEPVITKAGKTNVIMYNGHVLQNVYGGGKGYNALGYGGSHNLNTDGAIFGQTRVTIHGGTIGTEKGVSEAKEPGKVGNVFGGGDAGLIYSAYTEGHGHIAFGKKIGSRYDDNKEGAYYKYEDGDFVTVNGENVLTEDCKVLIEPWLQAKTADITIARSYAVGDIIPDEELEYIEEHESALMDKIDATGKVTAAGVSYTHSYAIGDYVSIDYLNTLPKKEGDNWTGNWAKVDVGTKGHERGIIIYNGVFAGGNIASSGTLSANVNTIFGNATASINDVYHRDFVTLGTGRVGGLYGDGNLTLVDGYRELNVTNYGTDYYSIDPEITRAKYDALFRREQDYYEIRYKCLSQCYDIEGTEYHPANDAKGIKASTITADELALLFVVNGVSAEVDGSGRIVSTGTGTPILHKVDGKWVPNGETYWKENGVCSRYAGRTMNTIQRADFCGVFGSRMVMRGARDRVLETANLTNYTINRVREVSLNKKVSLIAADKTKYGIGDPKEGQYIYPNAAEHGNYFGVYNVVNYLGALTSDLDFGDSGSGAWTKHGDIRTTDNTRKDLYVNPTANGKSYGTATYYDWKKEFPLDNRRNNGLSHNQLALASGVYLELTTEKSTGKGLYEKDWGVVTGVIQLDLINVSTGMGGGFVYAKNVHGVRNATGLTQTILMDQNKGAVTKKSWKYIETDPVSMAGTDQMNFQTSGNFVHNSQTIIDDCYNIGKRYKIGESPVPAHYWFIKGSVYVYDQYISAYTGAANAYSESIDIPLTITAASNGRIKLLNVQPNLYAYYASYTDESTNVKLGPEQKVVINEVDYHLNDPITYWEWSKLSAPERALFRENTYVNCVGCKVDGVWYDAGKYVMDDKDFTTFTGDSHTYLDGENHQLLNNDKEPATTEYVFRSSNNISHNNGYILTYQVNNPEIWNKWYTQKKDDVVGTKVQKGTEAYNLLSDENKGKYWDGPTYTPNTSNLYGQRDYELSDIISQTAYTTYNTDYAKLTSDQKTALPPQGSFERAYITTQAVKAIKLDLSTPDPDDTNVQDYAKGAKLAASEFSGTEWAKLGGKVAEAWVSTTAIQISDTKYLVPDELMTSSEKANYKKEVGDNIESLLKKKIPSITTARTNEILAMSPDAMSLTAAEETALEFKGITSLTSMLTAYNDIDNYVLPAYYCIGAGKFGGALYEKGTNYRGREAWSNLSDDDREHFSFNYDALDLLIDSLYSRNAEGTVIYPEGHKYQYDGYTPSPTSSELEDCIYSTQKAVDYTATFTGTYKKDNGTVVTITGEDIPKYKLGGTGALTSVSVDQQLTPPEYESIPNEQRHYSRINVTSEANTEIVDEVSVLRAYVVNTHFVNREGSFAVGQTITKDEYDLMTTEDKTNITTLQFPTTGTYYYCRQEYKVKELGEGVGVKNVASVTAKNSTGTDITKTRTYETSNDVPVPLGLVIDDDDYGNLPNKQLGFTISGLSPVETSTLYVSRQSDINDLSAEKIITVIYQYDYDESNESGTMITPYNERHVLNIHITFKSGLPAIGEIQEPGIVLPGNGVTPKTPTVTPGAYEVISTGWELFKKEEDAENGTNGSEYVPSVDPLYWYQDGYSIAYYVKTYLGKTYSNHVHVKVANYHDLKKVMDDKTHHLYVDRPDVKRDSKIYINNYAGEKDGIDLFKEFFDLSLISGSGGGYTVDEDDIITAASAPANSELIGHKLMDNHVEEGQNLEFFLRTDIDHSDDPAVADEWKPIAGEKDGGVYKSCFSGIFHGDGHAINGLDNSLFGHLCGSVYNLGVTGSFTSAGIVDAGKGYMENCWIHTSATPGSGVKPLFGNPNRDNPGQNIQIVNCYYPTENGYTGTHSATHGIPTDKPLKAFYDGEVTYDLNGFYLNKRYYDHSPSGSYDYKYYDSRDLDAGKPKLKDGKSPETQEFDYDYIVKRYEDGDFRYAAGTIPGSEDERFYEDPDPEKNTFYPLWPDDYYFFGQSLTYGYTGTHNDFPTSITKSGGRVLEKSISNHVHRAPAYYGDKNINVAHFNPAANLAAYSKPKFSGDMDLKEAYPGMTAIDFAGHNDDTWGKFSTTLTGGYSAFFPPLLDDDGLISVVNNGETDNLVVYAPAAAAASPGAYANAETYTVLSDYFTDLPFNDYYDNTAYRSVGIAPASEIYGHLVQSNLTTDRDHLLVDKEDFNAPIGYSFGTGKRMWYQRTPDNFVNAATGWEAVSLPFEVELVTTQDKGELTHFYTNSTTGHEYWLRNYVDKISETAKEVVLNMTYPVSSAESKHKETTHTKNATNTYLWDYYYSKNSRDDKNADKYQRYYETARAFSGYPYAKAGKPYIAGFPGERYYEFDLSGSFSALFTATPAPEKLTKQTITFASEPTSAETITRVAVSDDELANGKLTAGGFAFTPNYQTQKLPVAGNYVLNSKGSSFDIAQAGTTALPFRPYFKYVGSGSKPFQRLVFTNSGDTNLNPSDGDLNKNSDQGLFVYGKKGMIVVETNMDTEDVNITITDMSGALIEQATMGGHDTQKFPISQPGIYIVNNKKVQVK